MFRALFIVVTLCCATAAHAVLIVRTEQRNEIGAPLPAQRLVPIDLWVDPGLVDTQNEQLASFRIKLELSNSSPDGVRFALPPGPTSSFHPPVFPGVDFVDLGSDFNTIFVSAALPPGEGVDIVTDVRNGLLNATVEIPANVTPAGVYLVTIDPTEIGLFDVNGARILAIPGDPGGVFTPEPASGVITLSAFALLALRRARRR